MDYALIDNQRTWDNTAPGISGHVLLAPKDWFTEGGIKVPVAPFENAGDSITIKTAHEFKETHMGFIYFELAPRKNSLTAAVAGDIGFQRMNPEVEIVIPGSSPAKHELFQFLMNKPLVALVHDGKCGDGQYIQLGSKCEGAYLGGQFSTGTSGGEGIKGFTAKVSYDGPITYYSPGAAPKVWEKPEVIP